MITISKVVRKESVASLLVDGRPYVILGGELHNSSSSNLAYLDRALDRVRALACNTVLAPITWELVEPEEGRFDFTLVDGLLAAARARDLRVVPLWFGMYKNAESTYAPAWVKTDATRFPRARLASGEPARAVSVLCEEGRRCDARAFAAVMRRIKAMDAAFRTVILVQVENEVGLLGSPRDRSPMAEAAFAAAVPAPLLTYLQVHQGGVRPELRDAWIGCGRRVAGNWAEVFGPLADEVFMAWHFGRYVGAVAEAGRAEYDLPCFANAWLVQYAGQPAGEYPSGGPVSRMLDVWRLAAPAIDLLAPDIYLPEFDAICADYAVGGNALLIPEARREEAMAANAFCALGRHGALGFSPFGIESVGLRDAPPIDGAVALGSLGMTSSALAGERLAAAYRTLGGLAPLIAECRAAGRIAGVFQEGAGPDLLELGGCRLRIHYHRPPQSDLPPAAGILLSPRDGEFIGAGYGFAVDFLPAAGEAGRIDFLELWEGEFRGVEWIPGRRLNGDEYRFRFDEVPGIRRARIYRIGS